MWSPPPPPCRQWTSEWDGAGGQGWQAVRCRRQLGEGGRPIVAPGN